MKSPEERLHEIIKSQQEQREILKNIGFIWPGTITNRYLTCGRETCSCMHNPDARHGPYLYWTSKKSGKTITKKLSPEEAEILEPWIENRRTMESVMETMMQLSNQAYSIMLELSTSI